MSPNCENYNALRRKAGRLAMEIADLESRIDHPANFARRGEMPHATHIGWTWKTAWFYTPSHTRAACERRQEAAIAALPRLREKRERALAKAARLFAALPWGEQAALRIVGADPN